MKFMSTIPVSIWSTDFVVVETIALICAQDLFKKVIWVFKLSKDKIEAKIQQIDISRNSRYQYWYAYIHTYIETSPNRLFGWNNNFIFPTDVIVKVRNACDYGISVRFRLYSVDFTLILSCLDFIQFFPLFFTMVVILPCGTKFSLSLSDMQILRREIEI